MRFLQKQGCTERKVPRYLPQHTDDLPRGIARGAWDATCAAVEHHRIQSGQTLDKSGAVLQLSHVTAPNQFTPDRPIASQMNDLSRRQLPPGACNSSLACLACPRETN